jgi:hypothetical protein
MSFRLEDSLVKAFQTVRDKVEENGEWPTWEECFPQQEEESLISSNPQ